MSDLIFRVNAAWNGSGKTGEGSIDVGDHVIPYSVPAEMGGKGRGASPETLLISAVTACYSGTLYHFLQKRKLPVHHLAIATDGFVSEYPVKPRYSRIEVSPTVLGGDPNRHEEYVQAARMARDHCFIGQTVAAGGLSYELGTVYVTSDEKSGAETASRGAAASSSVQR